MDIRYAYYNIYVQMGKYIIIQKKGHNIPEVDFLLQRNV